MDSVQYLNDLHVYFSRLMKEECDLLQNNYYLFTKIEFLHLLQLIGCRYLDNACWVDTSNVRLKELEQKCKSEGSPTIRNVHLYDSSENWRAKGNKSSVVHIYGISIFDEIIKKQKQNQKKLT